MINEKSDVETFIKNSGKPHGFVYPGHFLPKNRNVLEFLRQNSVPYMIDPSTPRLTYPSFALTQGLRKLPYLPDPNSVLIPSALGTINELQEYVKGCLDWQLDYKSWGLIAPYHFCRDLNSEWLDIDIKLLEESISYAKSKNTKLPVLAGICLDINTYSNEHNRLALLNRYSRVNADGYIFYADEFDEKNLNPILIKSYLELMKGFQQLGKPVIAGRVGTVGLGFIAAGITGATSGIASLTGFSENNLLKNRPPDIKMQKKYYVPELMITVPVQMAEDILQDSRNSNLRCNCSYCKLAFRGLDKVSKLHFLEVRTRETNEIQLAGDSKDRIRWFINKVENAIQFCESIRKQQVVDLKPGFYSQLRIWKQVFESLV